MAHELEIRNGTASFVSARVAPWHRLGTITDHPMTVAEALELSRADYEVTKQPVYVEEGPGIYSAIENKMTTVRTDPDDPCRVIPLGVVGADYTIVQNRDAFAFLDELPRLHSEIVEPSRAMVETMGVLFGGRRAFASIKLPREIKVSGEDRTDLYTVIVNSHDGSLALTSCITPIRVVCNNTVSAALRHADRVWRLHHTQNITGRMAEARRTLGLTYAYAEEFESEARELLSRPLSTDRQVDVLKHLYPLPTDATDRTRRNHDNRISQVLGLTAADPAAGTAWGLYNGLVEQIDFYRPARATNGDRERAAVSKAQSLAWGSLADEKARAFAAIRDLVLI